MTIVEIRRWDPSAIIVNLNDELYAGIEERGRLLFALGRAKRMPIRRQNMRYGRTRDRVTAYYLSSWNTEGEGVYD